MKDGDDARVSDVTQPGVKPSNGPRKKRGGAPSDKDDGQVAQVLRTAYQRTVAEDIPSEMLDLLRKLD